MYVCVCVFSGASGEMGCGGGGHVAGFIGVRGVQGEVCGPRHPGLAADSAPETRPEGTAGQRALRQRLLLRHSYARARKSLAVPQILYCSRMIQSFHCIDECRKSYLDM